MPPVPFLDVGSTYTELKGELDAAIQGVLDSGWFIRGNACASFEAAFATYCGVDHCIGVGNGLEALSLVLEAAGIGPGDEVLVPAHTFIATWLAVTRVGATPVPVEPGDDGNLDMADASHRVTGRTKAIVPVHLYGRPADMTAVMAFADEHGLFVLEDAAQAQGATWEGRRTGGLGHAAGFSFYPGKNLGAFGDAGGVTTNDAQLAARVRELANYGSRTKYVHDAKGGNSRLDDLQAAVLEVKLRHLDAWNARRRGIEARYREALQDSHLTLPPADDPRASSVWHLFVVQSERRDADLEALHRADVAAQIHYPTPCHRTGAYQDSHGALALPRTDRLSDRVMSLPIGPHMSDAQVDRVIEAVQAL